MLIISTKNISIIFLLFANLSFSPSRVFLSHKRQIRQHHAASLDDQSIIFCLFCKLPSLSFALNSSMHLEGDNSIHFLWNSHFSGRVRILHSSEHCIQEGLVDVVGGWPTLLWPTCPPGRGGIKMFQIQCRALSKLHRATTSSLELRALCLNVNTNHNLQTHENTQAWARPCLGLSLR